MLLLVSRIATQASIGDVDASQATPSISTTHPPTQPQVQQHGAGSSRKRARGSSIRSSTLHDVWAPSLKKQAENVEERFFLPVQHSLPCFTYRLVKCKDDLRRMVADKRWLNWPDSTSILAVYLHDEVISNNAFWREIDGLQAALQPIVCVLHLCDSEGSTLGLLYEFMIRLRRAIKECTTLSLDKVDAMLDIFDARWKWFCRPIHCVAHMLHPAWRSDAQRSDRVLLTGWNTYVERMYKTMAVAREISLVGLPRMLKIKHFQFHGGKSLVVSILHCSVWLCEISQEMSSSDAERLWSIMGDIHTKDQNRLNTPQLDRLAFVNANLRVLEKAGGLEGVRPINWLSKQVDHWQIVVEAADVSQLQPRTAKDDVYDFIREDMMRSSRQTRSTTRRLRGESAVGTSSARPQRAARAREPRHSVAELTSASGRLTPTPSECESDDSCESDGSE
ncbi:hypothetical protein L7F22_041396 [Adiantum nelumboides]|nr:hypothetical protein [Adiantum nelumboides]